MNEKPDPPHPGNRAFTRVDLLALMASSALLLFIVLPALGRVTGKTIIAQCAANLEQYDMALQVYGAENQDYLPNISGDWPCDAPAYYLALITNTGVKWTSLFCPGNSMRFTEQDNWNVWTNWEMLGYGQLGYASAIPGITSMGFAPVGTYLFATNINGTLTMPRVNISGTYYPVIPASRALVADATVASTSGTIPPFPPAPPPAGAALNSAMLTYDWVGTNEGYSGSHLSGHMNGSIPPGGNVGMLDGHVEWRNLTNMLPRAGNGGGALYYFW
jgi:prepilin-type processing-associated H-X9-DG protein